MHEAAFYDHNVFVTLTYDDRHVPRDGNLRPRDLQLFIKRLRKLSPSPLVVRNSDFGIRYFASGEYGEQTGRPHYHALLFNCSFGDKERVGKDLFRSEFLSSVWPFGDHKMGDVTPRSANYVAQYSMKKSGGRLDCDADGVVRVRPFLRMSRRPGIGSRFLDLYSSDLEGGFLVADGKPGPIPRAYKKKLDPEVVATFEATFNDMLRRNPTDRNAPDRLAAGEVIALRRVDSHSL